MADGAVIRFDNLRQRSTVVGEYAPVEAKAKSFISENAHGILRKVSGFEEVARIAEDSGKRTRTLLSGE